MSENSRDKKSYSNRRSGIIVIIILAVIVVALAVAAIIAFVVSDSPSSVEGISIDIENDNMTEGDEAECTATVTMSDESVMYDGDYVWDTSDPTVLSVTGSGATASLKAVSAGQATVTVTADGIYYSIKITVSHGALESTEGKAATCTEEGNSEYWTCPICQKNFSDSEGKEEISLDSTVIEASGHSMTHTEAVEATCTEEGNKEYWSCSTCQKYFSDSNGETEILPGSTVIAALGHSLTHTDAVGATCTEEGNSEYWSCSTCQKYFSDSNGKEEISLDSTVIAALGHSLTHIQAVGATCTVNGNKEYWTCSICQKYFSDSNGKEEISLDSTIIEALGHSLTHTEAVGATCTEEGNKEYWTCSTCQKYFSDSNGKEEISLDGTIIAALGHSYEESTTQQPTCTEAGQATYICSVCSDTYTEPIAALGHSLTHIQAVEATCTVNGNIEYWSCSTCNLSFADEACTQEICPEDTVICPLGHDWDDGEKIYNNCLVDDTIVYTCNRCEETKSECLPAKLTLVLDPVYSDYSDAKEVVKNEYVVFEQKYTAENDLSNYQETFEAFLKFENKTGTDINVALSCTVILYDKEGNKITNTSGYVIENYITYKINYDDDDEFSVTLIWNTGDTNFNEWMIENVGYIVLDMCATEVTTQ